MSTTEQQTPPESTAPQTCPRCGAPLRPDQDWCLQCGTAVTTEVAGAPGWRAPIAIVGAVLAVAAVALVIAFVQLSDDADRVAATPAGTPAPGASAMPSPTPTPAASTTPVPTPAGSADTPEATPSVTPEASATPGATTTPAPTPGGTGSGGFASWPAGTTAYTVIMWSASSRSEAERKAEELQGKGASVGILDSSDYASLRPGYHVVFSGQYDTLDEAQDAAEAAQANAPGAYAKQVKPK